MPDRRLANAFFAALTTILVVAIVAEAVMLWGIIEAEHALGADLVFFRDIARHWLETGEFYLPRQLAGPYVVETLVDVLYPPIALYLFVPFLWLPDLLWWAIPFAVFGASIAWLRPAPWAWPLIAAGIAWPQTVSQVLYGNTNMWIAAFIAAGLCVAWPSVLVLIKPSLAPFALIGIRRRRWWIGLGVLGLAAIPFGSLWVDYATAMRNSSLVAYHALITLPLMLAPIWAWLARRPREKRRDLEPDSAAEAVPHVDDLAPVQVE
jgi:hypothetical protein